MNVESESVHSYRPPKRVVDERSVFWKGGGWGKLKTGEGSQGAKEQLDKPTTTIQELKGLLTCV